MKFLSVCSGIEAASMAWNPLGWHAAAFSEIEPFPCAVLAHHYPNIPNLGDMTQYEKWPADLSIDLLCGGTPCQSFSVAGLRKGLVDPRGNLMLTFGAIAAKYRPQWLVWENVPGVLSSNGGRDFGAFLGMLGQLGYGFAYRILDAQYFGVAQRRRRVFVVGYFGDWRAAAAVLFERHSLQGHPAPRRKTREEIAPTLRAGAANGGRGHGARSGDSKDELIVPVAWPADVARTLDAHFGDKMGLENQHVNAGCPLFVPAIAFHPSQDPISSSDGTTHGLGCGSSNGQASIAVAYGIAGNIIGRKPENGGNGLGFDLETSYTQTKTDVHGVAAFKAGAGASMGGIGYQEQLSPTLTEAEGGNQTPAILQHMQVRRLTPRECERLQGFPDDYTAIPWRNRYQCQSCGEKFTDKFAKSIGGLAPAECPKCGEEKNIINDCPDSPRYKALGNSWAVPNVRWIGERINAVDQILQDQRIAA